MQNIQERALADAWFYASLAEDLNLSSVFAKTEFKETINEPTGYWLHVYPDNSKIASLAVSEFDNLACLFAIRGRYVGLRVFSEGNQLFEFYFAGNPRFESLLDPISVAKQNTIWAYSTDVLAFNILNKAKTPELNKQIIRSLKESGRTEANKILALSCIGVVPLMHKLTLEITVPTYSDAELLTQNYLSDFMTTVRGFGEIDLIYFFVGLSEDDRVCCGRYRTKK